MLDRLGLERFSPQPRSCSAAPLARLPLADCEPRPPLDRRARTSASIRSRQPGQVYCGVALPLGRMTVAQMRGIADIASATAAATSGSRSGRT